LEHTFDRLGAQAFIELPAKHVFPFMPELEVKQNSVKLGSRPESVALDKSLKRCGVQPWQTQELTNARVI